MIRDLTARCLYALVPETRLGLIALLVDSWVLIGLAGCAVFEVLL
jgi:hypothetical protein